jgi:hypothetical protein
MLMYISPYSVPKLSMHFASLHMCHMTRPSHSSWFVHHNVICWVYELWSCYMCNFLHPCVDFSLVGPIPSSPPYVAVKVFHKYKQQVQLTYLRYHTGRWKLLSRPVTGTDGAHWNEPRQIRKCGLNWCGPWQSFVIIFRLKESLIYW